MQNVPQVEKGKSFFRNKKIKYVLTSVAILVFILFVVTQMFPGQGKWFLTNENSTSNEVFTKNTEAEIDAIFNEEYPANSPGAAILIAKDDKVLYRKAFGMANLELGVHMKPENVFQLASITKQFTGVAILMLAEQGKLNLNDSLSKYIPDYPRGGEITLHHLLNHTSGIQSYTNLPEFRAKTRLDMTPEELIGSFKNLPLQFNPGEKYEYSNSGYVLLGYIIEKQSGMSYEDFVQKSIFDRLGMKNSYYANSYKIIPNRATGYQLYEGNYENAEYMSTTIPYAAGSLMSTVDDMFLWSKAIHNNILISEQSKLAAFTNYVLVNGKNTDYGYGWMINELEGIKTVEHAGGINGFTTSGIYIPSRNMYAIVLTNRDDGKGAETPNLKAVSAVLGKPITEKIPVTLSEEELKKWVGAYQFEDVVRFITYEAGVLHSMREGGRPIKLEPLSDHEFQFEDLFTTYTFSVKDGKKQAVYSNRIKKSIGVDTDKKPISEKESVQLDLKILNKYIGVYELQPSFQIETEVQNGRLFAKASGQPLVELFAESETSFFIKEIGGQIVFNLANNGTVKSLSFSQGGAKMEGKKIK